MPSIGAFMAENAANLEDELARKTREHIAELAALRAQIPDLSQAMADVIGERKRHFSGEGWTQSHDDNHSRGEMCFAALNYTAAAALTIALGAKSYSPDTAPPLNRMGYGLEWPWARSWWKPGTIRRMLVKAASLIVAEIERLDRAEDRARRAAAATHLPPLDRGDQM